jgi:triosephosphate isomerase
MNKLIVANWKMEFSHLEALDWLTTNFLEVRKVVDETDHELVICPSFTELPFALAAYPEYFWGAQDCASVALGAYTGDVSALSLHEMGVSFTIVGHSERRKYYDESDEDVRRKTALLLEQEIQPIVCIGETEVQKGMKHEVLKEQLSAVTDLFIREDTAIIAYEPVWAIGTGITPTEEELKDTVEFIRTITGDFTPYVLYGGSVNPAIARNFSSFVDGFLVGSASCDSEVLKKIILSC